MNRINKLLNGILIAGLLIPGAVYASKTQSTSYSAKTTINEDTKVETSSYDSSTGGENALLVTNGKVTIESISVNKTGDESGDNSDFYGTNAAILVNDNGTLNIEGGEVTTNGSHANAVFAYTDGIINISDTIIKTSSNNSGGIMVTGGGEINASNLTVETSGGSSAPIRSDRGGGTITVNGGTYTSNGTGSPTIYSTADIIVNAAKLVSNVSSGVVIEGDNSVTLNDVELYANNTKSNSKGEEANYKNIFIYQSTSGDAKEGTGTFKSTDSTIITDNGSTIFVTNTTADITLENNQIINNDENNIFLKATKARWGKEGSNGGNVILKLIDQEVSGDIILDEISTLTMSLEEESVLTGAINTDNTAKNISVSLTSNSIISLTNDSYITSLENEIEDNSNIYSNGKYKLYVNGEEVQINEGMYNEDEINENVSIETVDENDNLNIIYIVTSIVFFVIISIVITLKIKKV